MSEIQSSDFSETAASNNVAVPNGWPESQLPSTVNDCAREMMAAIKRDWNRSHVTISSTGSANAYVLTYANAPTYTHGIRLSFKANFANTGAATANANALGAKSIVRGDGTTALAANDIVVNQHVDLEYDSALDKLVMLTVPGTMVTTGANTFLGDQTITAGAINTARATVASAATTADIWAADGNQIDWTGTTTCTGFPAAPQAGVSRTLICADAAPFTAGANMLIDGVSSGSTVTCAANDKMIVEAVTTTQFRLSRVKYDGTAQVSGGLVLLSTVTAANSATVDVETGFGATYDDYIIIADGVRPATDTATLSCQFKLTGAYVATSTYYYHVQVLGAGSNLYSANVGAAVAQIRLSPALDNANAASAFNFTMDVQNANTTTLAHSITWRGASADVAANAYEGGTGYGSNAGTGALSGVRFAMSAGNISVGTFRLYGVAKS